MNIMIMTIIIGMIGTTEMTEDIDIMIEDTAIIMITVATIITIMMKDIIIADTTVEMGTAAMDTTVVGGTEVASTGVGNTILTYLNLLTKVKEGYQPAK